MFELAGGRVSYSFDEALATIKEYAFGVDPEPLAPAREFADGPVFPPHPVPKYAYRSYDCVPASPGARISDLDLLVAAGLNAFSRPAAGIDVRLFYALRSFADRASGHLEIANAIQPDFLMLTDMELGDDPPAATAGWHLNQAWRQGIATPDLGVARVHKVLHHKRPRLFPLVDRRTLRPIGAAAEESGCNEWQLIHREVQAHREEFDRLAQEFDRLVTDDYVSLSHLRLYDILVWMRSLPRRVALAEPGQPR